MLVDSSSYNLVAARNLANQHVDQHVDLNVFVCYFCIEICNN